MSEAEFNLKKISLLILFWGGVLVISGYFLVHIFVYHWPKIATTLYKEQLPAPSENNTTPTATVAATPVSSVSATLINDLLHAIMLANKQQASESATATTATKLKTPEQNQTQTITKTASGSANPKKKNL